VPGLIKAIEVQLLSSDLSTSVLPPSTNTSFLQANHPDPDPHAHEQKRRVLFRAPDSDLPTQNKNNSKKAGVLVQIVQVDDVAHSALSLSETLQEKKEARKLAAKGRAGGDGDGGRIMDLNDDAEDDEGDLDAEAKRRALLHGGKGGGGGPSFPRGSGRFVLTDGGPAQWTAFELQRIAGMGLEELRLGTKVRMCVSCACWLRVLSDFLTPPNPPLHPPSTAPHPRRPLHQRDLDAHAPEHDRQRLPGGGTRFGPRVVL
jgi:hypothetical protein